MISALVVMLFYLTPSFYSTFKESDEARDAVIPTDLIAPGVEEKAGTEAVLPAAQTVAALLVKEASAPKAQPKVATTSPQRLRIPSIGVDAFVEEMGLTPQGNMDAPA